MAEYELVHEIKNQCPNNQMRDVFFEEVECADPADYIRNRYAGKVADLTANQTGGGAVTVHAVIDGLMPKFVFTPI